MSGSGVISRRLLHDELADRIRAMIVAGEIAAGTRINERALCERFGVSRTPLREALKVLSLEGYVSLTPNRGASVPELTVTDLEEAFPVMGALEALAGELACRNASAAEIAAILDLHDAMRRHHRGGDRQAYFDCNERIHLGIAEAAGNATLVRMQRALDGRVRRGRYQANVDPVRWDQAMAEHEVIAQRLAARDAEGLARILRLHLENKLASLLRGTDR